MKRLNLFGLLLCVAVCLVSCNDDEISGGDEMGGNNGGGNSSTSIKPPMEGEGLKLVGSWKGYGPYVASGSSSSKYGLVNGTWEFYNDSTYSWIGYNSFGYSYIESGKWHYNTEKEILTTDSPCGLNWEIEEISENQWVGTLLGSKKGTYTYTRNDGNKDIRPGNMRIIDYRKGGFTTRDTIVNYRFCTKEIKCGVCYGTEDDKDVSTFKKIYATKTSTSAKPKVYDIEINSLKENGRYKLCSFIEHEDGGIEYGKVYNAICITPPQNTVYLGEDVSDRYNKVYFWSSNFISKDDFTYDEASEYISQLGKKWKIPSYSDVRSVFKRPNSSCEIQMLKGYRGELDSIQSKSRINGNKLCLNLLGPSPIYAGFGDSYMQTDNFWISDIQDSQHCSLILYNSVKNSSYEAGEIYFKFKDYSTAKILPVYEVAVKW